MAAIVKEGELFKLPTWSKGPATELEKQFKLRFFTLRQDGESVRLIYYKTKEVYTSGGAPSGSIEVLDSDFERINKLDFVLSNDKKRLWCRAFSEILANQWEESLMKVGVGQGVAPEQE